MPTGRQKFVNLMCGHVGHTQNVIGNFIMTISTTENIYSDFRATFKNTPEFIIDYYTKNTIYFNNIKSFKDKEELRQYIEMTCKYVEAIYLKDRFNSSIDLADKFIAFIDTEITRLNAQDLKDNWYYSFSFVKGMASYKLKDYKTAKVIFEKLVAYDNQNDNYYEWLQYAKHGLKMWVSKIIAIVSCILIVVEIFFKDYIASYTLRMTLNGLGFLGLTFSLAYDWYLKRSMRKKKRAV